MTDPVGEDRAEMWAGCFLSLHPQDPLTGKTVRANFKEPSAGSRAAPGLEQTGRHKPQTQTHSILGGSAVLHLPNRPWNCLFFQH